MDDAARHTPWPILAYLPQFLQPPYLNPNMNIKTTFFFCLLFLSAQILHAADVVVIAHSVSTSMEARNVLARFKLREVPFKQADGVLVVCRSMLFNPLQGSYADIRQLNRDAANQLNIAGSNFHVYIYQIENDLSVVSLKHFSYKAD